MEWTGTTPEPEKCVDRAVRQDGVALERRCVLFMHTHTPACHASGLCPLQSYTTLHVTVSGLCSLHSSVSAHACMSRFRACAFCILLCIDGRSAPEGRCPAEIARRMLRDASGAMNVAAVGERERPEGILGHVCTWSLSNMFRTCVKMLKWVELRRVKAMLVRPGRAAQLRTCTQPPALRRVHPPAG